MPYTVISRETLAPGLCRMRVSAPRVAHKSGPGQFVMIRAVEGGERIPLTIAASDRENGLITLMFQEVGATTRLMASIPVGDALESVTGPLGMPTEFANAKRVLCIGGGAGVAVLYPQVTALSDAGIAVDTIIGARAKGYLILEDELRAHSDGLYIATDDGSYGHKGFVTDLLKMRTSEVTYDACFAVGPVPMMRAICAYTKEIGLHTVVSLNPIMVDGTGMCGCCRVMIDGKIKYACVDGPDFDGHLVDFDSLNRRLRAYREQEAELNARVCVCAEQGGV